MLAMRQLIKLEADDMVKLARMLDDAGNTVDDVAKLKTEFLARREMISQLLFIQESTINTCDCVSITKGKRLMSHEL